MKLQEKIRKSTIHADHPCRILIVGGSGSEKTNTPLNLVNQHQMLITFICTLRILANPNIHFYPTSSNMLV